MGTGTGSYPEEGLLKAMLSALTLCILFSVEVFCWCIWLYVPMQHLAQCLHSNVNCTTISWTWTMPVDLAGSLCDTNV